MKLYVPKPKSTRKHVATGGKRGGARPGAGRPPGSKNRFPIMGTMKALQACHDLRMRIPASATPVEREIAQAAINRVVDVMNGAVPAAIATPVLKAAITLRDEICGPIVQKVDLTARVGLASLLDDADAVEKGEVVDVGPVSVVAALPPAVKEIVEEVNQARKKRKGARGDAQRA